MDREVAQTLAYFRENASDLKKLGKEWGLSNEDINNCIQRALSIDPKDLPHPETTASSTTRLKFAARKSWPTLRIFLWIVGGLMLLVGVGALALQNEHIELRFNQLMEPVMYPLFRNLRRAATPLHDVFDLYDSYMEDCVMNNPLYSKDTVLGDHACETCNTVTTVTQFTAESLKQGPGPVVTEPVLIKGKGQNVSLETFQQILSENPFIRQPMLGVTTNLEWAPQVKDLMRQDAADRLAAQPDFHFFWVSKLVATSQIMRKVFPRPDVFGVGAEIAIRKTIFITGPKSESFELRTSPVGTFSWYVQGWGSREVELTPADMCRQECSPILVLLNPGDILTYNCELYTATVKPTGENISISFLGHFNPIDF